MIDPFFSFELGPFAGAFPVGKAAMRPERISPD
jgi:hypothetical protein